MEIVVEYFRRVGFTVSDAFGSSCAIVGPVELFEDRFGVKLSTSRLPGGQEIRASDGGVELPLDSLPGDIRGLVAAATFTEPPAFGPTDFA